MAIRQRILALIMCIGLGFVLFPLVWFWFTWHMNQVMSHFGLDYFYFFSQVF